MKEAVFKAEKSVNRRGIRISSTKIINRELSKRKQEENTQAEIDRRAMEEFKRRGEYLKKQLKQRSVSKPLKRDKIKSAKEIQNKRYSKALEYWKSRKQEDLQKLAEIKEKEKLDAEKKAQAIKEQMNREKKKLNDFSKKMYCNDSNIRLETQKQLLHEIHKKSNKLPNLNNMIKVTEKYTSTKKKLEKLQKENEHIRSNLSRKKERVWELIESPEFINLLSRNKEKIRNVFSAYQKLHKHPLATEPHLLNFDCFYLFCLDFNIVPKTAQPRELKNALVVMDKFGIRGEKEFGVFDIEQFSEAIFVLAFAKVMLPGLSEKAKGKLDRSGDIPASKFDLDSFNTKNMEEFIEGLALESDYSKMAAKVQQLQEGKKAVVLRYLDSKF